MLVGAIRAPKLRGALAAALNSPQGANQRQPWMADLNWFGPDGINVTQLGEDYSRVGLLLSEHGILAYDAISEWPPREQDRPQLVVAILNRVFQSEPRGWMSEPELNARLSVLFFDPSGLRRFAVDNKLLAREADGSRYWLTSADD